MDDLNIGGMPDRGALRADLAGQHCVECGDPATTRCVGIRADHACTLVMYLCDKCRVEFMAFIDSGCMADYDAVLYRQRCVN